MMVFATGSCRCYYPLTYLHVQEKIHMVNPCETTGIQCPTYFFGNLHNVLEHEEIIKAFLDPAPETKYYMRRVFNQDKKYRNRWEEIWDHNKALFDQVDVVAIEVCSIKKTKDFPATDPNKLLECVDRIAKLTNKKLLWICHLRPQVFGHQSESINNREIIYKTLKNKVDLFDPSEHINSKFLMDLEHYNLEGIKHISEHFMERLNRL